MLFYVLEMHLISDIRCHKLFTETMNKSSRDMSQKIMYQWNKCYNKRDMIRLDATKIKRFQSVSKQAMIWLRICLKLSLPNKTFCFEFMTKS